MLFRIVKTWTLNDWRYGAEQTLFQTWVDMDWTWPCKLELSLSLSLFIKKKRLESSLKTYDMLNIKHEK